MSAWNNRRHGFNYRRGREENEGERFKFNSDLDRNWRRVIMRLKSIIFEKKGARPRRDNDFSDSDSDSDNEHNSSMEMSMDSSQEIISFLEKIFERILKDSVEASKSDGKLTALHVEEVVHELFQGMEIKDDLIQFCRDSWKTHAPSTYTEEMQPYIDTGKDTSDRIDFLLDCELDDEEVSCAKLYTLHIDMGSDRVIKIIPSFIKIHQKSPPDFLAKKKNNPLDIINVTFPQNHLLWKKVGDIVKQEDIMKLFLGIKDITTLSIDLFHYYLFFHFLDVPFWEDYILRKVQSIEFSDDSNNEGIKLLLRLFSLSYKLFERKISTTKKKKKKKQTKEEEEEEEGENNNNNKKNDDDDDDDILKRKRTRQNNLPFNNRFTEVCFLRITDFAETILRIATPMAYAKKTSTSSLWASNFQKKQQQQQSSSFPQQQQQQGFMKTQEEEEEKLKKEESEEETNNKKYFKLFKNFLRLLEKHKLLNFFLQMKGKDWSSKFFNNSIVTLKTSSEMILNETLSILARTGFKTPTNHYNLVLSVLPIPLLFNNNNNESEEEEEEQEGEEDDDDHNKNEPTESNEAVLLYVHKEILILKSNFFFRMFKNPWHETTQSSEKTEISSLGSDSMKCILEYLYLGEIPSLLFSSSVSKKEYLIGGIGLSTTVVQKENKEEEEEKTKKEKSFWDGGPPEEEEEEPEEEEFYNNNNSWDSFGRNDNNNSSWSNFERKKMDKKSSSFVPTTSTTQQQEKKKKKNLPKDIIQERLKLKEKDLEILFSLLNHSEAHFEKKFKRYVKNLIVEFSKNYFEKTLIEYYQKLIKTSVSCGVLRDSNDLVSQRILNNWCDIPMRLFRKPDQLKKMIREAKMRYNIEDGKFIFEGFHKIDLNKKLSEEEINKFEFKFGYSKVEIEKEEEEDNKKTDDEFKKEFQLHMQQQNNRRSSGSCGFSFGGSNNNNNNNEADHLFKRVGLGFYFKFPPHTRRIYNSHLFGYSQSVLDEEEEEEENLTWL